MSDLIYKICANLDKNLDIFNNILIFLNIL